MPVIPMVHYQSSIHARNRFRGFAIVLSAVLYLLLTSTVQAQSQFGVEVAVNGQDNDEKISAYQVAMRIVLLRNSGDKTLLNRDDVREALGAAETYVQQFSYRVPGFDEKITGDTPLTRRVRETSEATHLLTVQFSGIAINELIAGLVEAARAESEDDEEGEEEVAEIPDPVSALVWLMIVDGETTHLIGGQTGQNIIERAREIAGGVGLQLEFPLLDGQDQQLLIAEAIRTGNQAAILAASDRYQEPVVLTGLLTRSTDRSWLANWSRYHADQIEDLNGESASLDQSLQEGIRWLAPGRSAGSDKVGSGFSSFNPGVSHSQGLIWISALNTPDRYATTMRLLNDIETVELAYPTEVMDTGMLFAVLPRSAVNDVAARIAEVGWIQATSVSAPLPGSSAAFSSIRQADAFFEYLR